MEVIQELLPGAFVIKYPKYRDNRGWLSVPFNYIDTPNSIDVAKFDVVQVMVSFSGKGVIRGLHYQAKPFPVGKMVSCLKGTIYDVIVDIREGLISYGSWACIALDEDDDFALYVPAGFAHGYASLTEGTQVLYFQDEKYDGGASRILAWDDPDLNIRWPIDNPILSERDRTQGGSWVDYKAKPEF